MQEPLDLVERRGLRARPRALQRGDGGREGQDVVELGVVEPADGARVELLELQETVEQTRSVIGTLIGAVIVGVFRNGLQLTGVASVYQILITGVLVILAVSVDRLTPRRRQ